MNTYQPTNGAMIRCIDNTGGYLYKKDIEELLKKVSKLARYVISDMDDDIDNNNNNKEEEINLSFSILRDIEGDKMGIGI